VDVARKWVRSNFKAFNESHVMYEKVCNWFCSLCFRSFHNKASIPTSCIMHYFLSSLHRNC
jgi:hypothetical protein